jgi:hypothetical protein
MQDQEKLSKAQVEKLSKAVEKLSADVADLGVRLTAAINEIRAALPPQKPTKQGPFGKCVTAVYGCVGDTGLSVIAVALAIGSLYWFGLYRLNDTKFEPAQSAHYLFWCSILYAVWTIGVPTWFALEFIFIYDKKTPSLEERKVNIELTKSAWISVAVVLAAIFAVRTHLEFKEKVEGAKDKEGKAHVEQPAPAANKQPLTK